MDIYLHNTLTRKKELFTPITPGKVTMYHCGPTVYNYAHIGNLRAYVFADIVRRVFEFNNYTVTQVINITDLGELSSDGEDKMVKGLKREGKPLTLEAMKEMADFYAEKFKEDLKALNIHFPSAFPKASEYVGKQIEFIQTLEQKGFTYTTSDGVYFDTAKFPEYGKLVGPKGIQIDEEYSRIGINTEKKDPKDFTLWKLSPEIGFESPWGKGFPGWHIECSTMSVDLLGETLDIHTGGIDHIPVHHTNEIAQSESATGKQFVHYWLHSNFININDQKISKSLQNEMYLKELKEQGYSPLAYRYFLLTAHYSTLINFTYEALAGAQTAFNKLISFYTSLADSIGNVDEEYFNKFSTFINDDLNTPKALALTWELIKDEKIATADKKATLLKFDEVLGLDLAHAKSVQEDVNIPEAVVQLVAKREEARKEKNWKEADELRSQIHALGFDVKDTDQGSVIEKI